MRFENHGKEPTARRRLTAEAMMARDIEIARLREQGVSFRDVAARLGCSVGSVQLAVKRLAQPKPPDPGPNLLEMYRAMRGLSGPEQEAALAEFRVAADEYRRSVTDSPDLEDRVDL